MVRSDISAVKQPEDCAPDAEEDEVPEEADGDVEEVLCQERQNAKDDGCDDGENACDNGSDLLGEFKYQLTCNLIPEHA